MKISASNTNCRSFGANLPVWKVLARLKSGDVVELPSEKLRGPIQALVSRLNDSYSREADFFAKKIKIQDFIDYPLATSSILGRNDYKKKHIILGWDAKVANDIREDCYRNTNMTVQEVRDFIHRSLIDPFSKKVRKARFNGDKIGEQVGLVLYTDEVRDGYYKLNGLKLTSIDDKRNYGVLEPIVKEKKRRANTISEQVPSEKSSGLQDTQINQNITQDCLFNPDEYKTYRSPWETDVPIKKGKK